VLLSYANIYFGAPFAELCRSGDTVYYISEGAARVGIPTQTNANFFIQHLLGQQGSKQIEVYYGFGYVTE